MPGVLLVEAMSQCGGLLVLNRIEDPERWSTYFLKIDDVKFRRRLCRAIRSSSGWSCSVLSATASVP